MNTENIIRPVSELDVEEWKSCIGRQKVQHAVADSEVLRRFALAAGIDANVVSATPALSHWALFVDAVADERIGPDGHPKRGDFLPNVFLPRRMFAAAEMTFHSPLQLGLETKMVSTITSLNHKSGRSGDLVFVKVQREVSQTLSENESQGNTLCVTEEQTIVYRPAGDPVAPIQELDQSIAGSETWTPGPVQLFRFSAMTFNSHRIHYDLPYATGEEGYPGLVVHGPFTAVKLLDYACKYQAYKNQTGDKAKPQAHKFSFRGLSPMFVSQPILLSAGDEPNKFVATRCDGNVGMTADVQFK